ncbi:MAG: hypothetical protein P4L55_07795, partial [Syntrophobacteraceae bacterium]|nr:hypothetical protein [Syntrophobacteraceae bacterium]
TWLFLAVFACCYYAVILDPPIAKPLLNQADRKIEKKNCRVYSQEQPGRKAAGTPNCVHFPCSQNNILLSTAY